MYGGNGYNKMVGMAKISGGVHWAPPFLTYVRILQFYRPTGIWFLSKLWQFAFKSVENN